MSLQHYRVCVKEYIARGRDGYATLRDCPTIVTAKNGPVLSTTVQNYFEGIVRPCKSRGCLHRCVTFDRNAVVLAAEQIHIISKELAVRNYSKV